MIGSFNVFRMYFVAIVFLSFVASCDTGEKSNNANSNDYNFDVAKSSETRNMNPAPSSSDLTALIEGNNEFAIELYKKTVESSEYANSNVFFSPFSISEALAMTWAGSKNNTETEMADTLHFFGDQNKVHNAFNSLDLYLSGLGNGNNEQFSLKIANAIWGQIGYSFISDFLDTLAINYGAGINLLDFGADPESARQIINDWVEDKTEHKIKDLLPQGSVSNMTRLVLTNAIYFKAEWEHTFDSSSTAEGDFVKSDGSVVTADFMHLTETFNFYRENGLKVIELPYKGGETSMVIFQPDATSFSDFESSMDATTLDTLISQMNETEVTLSMPKFTFAFSFLLNDYLKNLGINDAFDASKADFSGITQSETLFISKVLHKAFVAVNEKGTEAAASTAVILDGTAEGENINLNTPFIFIIRDVTHGSILFMGRITEPVVN